MAIKIYRRHSPSCEVLNLPITAKQKRAFLGCSCHLWACGTTNLGPYPRQSLRTNNLDEAKVLVARAMAEDADEKIHGPRIADSIDLYMDSREHELSTKTYGQHRLCLDRWRRYCEGQGMFFMREVTLDSLERFKLQGLPKMETTSLATMIAKLKSFLKEAFRRGWLAEDLAGRMRTVKAVYRQKQPFTDEDIDKIMAEAAKLKGGSNGFASQPETFVLLLKLMLETGMRVSDAVMFDPAKAVLGERLWVYTFHARKTKKTEAPRPIEAFISKELIESIRKCNWLSSSLPFNYRPDSPDPDSVPQSVYERMQDIGARCGVADCRPHRLRDSFAVRMLLRGMSLQDVSRLLGHSSVVVTERYYAAWVTARKRRLEGLVAEALVDSGSDAGGNTERRVTPKKSASNKAKDSRLVGKKR